MQTVRTYSGYKGDERPVSFPFGGRELQVRRIVRSWYDPDHLCFFVEADDGKSYLLRHHMSGDAWEVRPAADHQAADEHRRSRLDR